MTYDGTERRTGEDRRKGPRRNEDASFAAEGPGGFKLAGTIRGGVVAIPIGTFAAGLMLATWLCHR